QNRRFKQEDDIQLLEQIEDMRDRLEKKIKQPFWMRIGKLDRSVMSLVLQMAPNYRDAFQIFLTVSKGLALQGKIYQMSVKDEIGRASCRERRYRSTGAAASKI